ncbi:unnamed protein product [Heligmosomoides polygyrus]|uniref:Uncharacterized protein n=1 Tax=Heligmosomoides polygyrus TaxID=6339 RepID=A0A183FTW0_HELPZ|nr:unnamed protein product [Heligmosomoides polygyrus]
MASVGGDQLALTPDPVLISWIGSRLLTGFQLTVWARTQRNGGAVMAVRMMEYVPLLGRSPVLNMNVVHQTTASWSNLLRFYQL